MIDNTKRLHFSIDSIVEAVAIFLNAEKCDLERVLLYCKAQTGQTRRGIGQRAI